MRVFALMLGSGAARRDCHGTSCLAMTEGSKGDEIATAAKLPRNDRGAGLRSDGRAIGLWYN
ncbi:MAG: hypothetical protein J7K94_01180 [Dehalococcoidia bacterium]|nr:hypothetical protein [Dehalococcoidia bacterium]